MKSIKYPVDLNSNAKLSELWLQYLWKKNVFSTENLFTTTGQRLKIQFNGWYNKSWGPDFKESRITIGSNEYFGDIEIHVDEAAWFHHLHHQNETYNKVILHVFLNKSEHPAINYFNQNIPSLCLKSEFLNSFWEAYSLQPGFKIEELPGVCGLSLSKNLNTKIKSIIQQAAENRLIDKSAIFTKPIKEAVGDEIDNILYTSICKSLGYVAHSEQFISLSQRFPYSHLKNYFKSMHRQSRIEVLSRWLGYLGLLDSIEGTSLHEDLRREWVTLVQKWNQISEEGYPVLQPTTAPYRPFNSPIRRLIGLYYHLEYTNFKGLFSAWLSFLHSCRLFISDKKGKIKILNALDLMFPQPSWDPFSYFKRTAAANCSTLTTKFIGAQKQLVVLVNSIIPFYLSWARLHNDQALEKLLYRLLLILPNEGKNRKTKFMENRLFKDYNSINIKKNLSYHQGLIQIHDDCCTSFYEGCENCSFLKWLLTTD